MARTSAPSAEFPYPPRYVDVLGSRMHYVESGPADGAPILFVHGNPTSSYLWRNIIPAATPHGRAIAVDLIGMGRSDKPDIPYRFFDHLRYLEGFVEALGLADLTLVLHDWGGGLGISYARRHPDNVRAIAFMEAVVTTVEWSDANAVERFVFKRMRHPEKGDRMNLDNAFFLKRLMPMMIRRRLTAAEKAAYLEPYPTRESRRPVAQWPREIPFSGEPADMWDEIGANYEWLRSAPQPKLFLHASPGVIFKKRAAAELIADVDGIEEVHVGRGKHYIQEDQPEAISAAIGEWLRRLGSPAPGRRAGQSSE